MDDQNERDINSVAGVLKLYFRGLENPLFPKERFQDLISTISKSFLSGMISSLTNLYWSGTPGLSLQEGCCERRHMALVLLERKT